MNATSKLCAVGSSWAGPYSDRVLISLRKGRNGVWIGEDRLRATYLGGAVLAPMSILVSGLFTQFWPGNGSFIPNMICLIVNGIGVSSLKSTSRYVPLTVGGSRRSQLSSTRRARTSLISCMTEAQKLLRRTCMLYLPPSYIST